MKNQQQQYYWGKKWNGEIPILNLPYDFPRPIVQSFAGASFPFQIDAVLSRRLQEFCQEQDCTLHMLLFATFQLLLHKYSGQEDIVTGVPVLGRSFVNTLAIRTQPQKDKTWAQFLEEAKQANLQAFEHQDFLLEDLVEELKQQGRLRQDPGRNPLFDCLFSLENTKSFSSSIPELDFEGIEPDLGVTKFDLTLRVIEKPNSLQAVFEYSTALFKQESVAFMAQHFLHLLALLVEPQSLSRSLTQLSPVSEQEKKTLLQQYNQTEVEYPSQATVHWLFEEQVKKTPHQIALVFEEQKLTYQECNERANHLAQHLHKAGINKELSLAHQQESFVAVLAQRSPEWALSILAILKAGGTYFPLDPRAPQARLAMLFKDSGVQFLLAHRHFEERFSKEFQGKVFYLDDPQSWSAPTSEEKSSAREEQPEDPFHQNRLCHVLYTSGSTGIPKGALLGHQGMVNFAFDHIRRFEIGEEDQILQFANPAFDISLMEVFITLLSGATLHLIPQNVVDDYQQLEREIQKKSISLMLLPPFYLALMNPQQIQSLRIILTAGSATNFSLVKKWGENIQYVNSYGHTENSITSTIYNVPQELATRLEQSYASVPVGLPCDNVQVYIVDENLELQPTGVPGELCVGGESLAFEYLNRPELTQEKFINAEQVEWMAQAGISRIYRTGDLVRWLPTKEDQSLLEFLGRIDLQVKIRGQRIELGEIESQMQELPQIHQAAVIDRLDAEIQEEKYLCAYYIPAQDSISPSELRKSLAETLPAYMIPSYFVEMEKIPLTLNDKLNRKALPQPDLQNFAIRDYQAPANALEKELAQLWEELLGISKIGRQANFFDLGGHSLTTMNLQAKIQSKFGVQLLLSQFFQAPTIQKLALLIQAEDSQENEKIPQAAKQEYYLASSVQRRLHVLQQFDKKAIHYNVTWKIHCEGFLDAAKLESAFQGMIQRHEALRTSLLIKQDQVQQKIHDHVDWNLEVLEIAEQEQQEKQLFNWVRPFDLEQAPLFRAGVAQVAPQEHILYLDFHHTIMDGLSMEIFWQEWMQLYQGKELEKPSIQYKDFTLWQEQQRSSPKQQIQRAAWLKCFAEEIPVLNLPYDFPRPTLQSFVGAHFPFQIDPVLNRRLRQFCQEQGCNFAHAFVCCVSAFLAQI